MQFSLDNENNLTLFVQCKNEEITIYPYFNENSGITYFFLPAFIDEKEISFVQGEIEELSINNTLISNRNRFEWEEDVVYSLTYNECNIAVQFMKSENLPTIFLETESGNLDYLNLDKNNSESGYVKVVQNSGNIEYKGKLKKISERGQSTFGVRKKSFSLTLEDKYPLCGLDSGKKWNLLSLYYEQNKIQSKIIYDMAEFLGMEYATGSTWVDVYINGSWGGVYLLTEAVTVGEGRVDIYDLGKANKKFNEGVDFDTLKLRHDEKIGYYDIESPPNISSGYLIEKEYVERLHMQENAYFITDAGLCFSLKRPKKASKAEVKYVAKFFQNIENLLETDDENYKEYLDDESFAKQFLIDKIVLEIDAMTASTFFYIDRDGNVLKSGPLWDYDRAMGREEPDYTLSIEGWPGEMSSWYNHLYQDKEFKEKMLRYYLKLLPYIETILNERIDEYAEWTAASRKMDRKRWGYTGENFVIYLEYENDIKYLKYFIINRLEYLNNEWGISYDFSRYKNRNADVMHTVTLQRDDGRILATFDVKEGECIDKLPAIETESGKTWYYSYSNVKQSDKIPVFESVTFTYR